MCVAKLQSEGGTTTARRALLGSSQLGRGLSTFVSCIDEVSECIPTKSSERGSTHITRGIKPCPYVSHVLSKCSSCEGVLLDLCPGGENRSSTFVCGLEFLQEIGGMHKMREIDLVFVKFILKWRLNFL